MSKLKVSGNASGTGVITLEAPNTNTDRAITLPDSAGTLLMTDGDGSNLTGLSHTPEGTAVLSTGETGATKFLREDGDGTCSWQAAAAGGKVLQVVNAYKTNYSTTSSTTFADSGLSVTITPTLATSSIMLLINFQNVWMPTASDQRLWIKLLRDSTGLQNMSTTIGHSSANERVGTWSGVWIDSPSTTSSTVYKMQMRAQQTGSTIYFNYNAGQSEVGTSTITAIEIGA